MALIKPLLLDAGIIRQMAAADTYFNQSWLKPVRTLAETAVTLASAVENGDAIGGVTLATGDRVLLVGQADPKENGIYVVKASGAPDRAEDAATGAALGGRAVAVTEGDWFGTVWVCQGSNSGPAVVGVSNLAFIGPLLAASGSYTIGGGWRFGDFFLIDGTTGFGLQVECKGNTITADRTLLVDVGDADRTITVTGDATVTGTNTGDIQPVSGCSLTNSANLSINSASFTVLTFDTEVYDAGGFHSTSSNTGRITIPANKGGKYLLTCSLTWAANATGVREAFFRVNGGAVNPADGALVCQQASTAGNVTGMAFSAPVALAAGDYVEVLVYQDSGGAVNVLGGVGYSPVFSATFLGT